MNMSTIRVTDIKPGMRIFGAFLVIEKNLAFSQKGNPYLNLRLRDRTGDIEGRVWENAVEMGNRFQKADVIHIDARAVSFRDIVQLSISSINPVDEKDIDPADYSPVSRYDLEDMFEELISHVETVQDPHLKELLSLIFEDANVAESFKKAPAAKGFHHSYIGGLLEHTLSVVKVLDLVTSHYPQLNRDLVITGGILHDIGKIEELSYRRMIGYTDEGRLIGHIVLGVEFVDSKLRNIEDFPQKLAMELRHVLLSHHGVLEYGSPKRPKTLEALVVNFIDDMDAKINAFQEFMNEADDDATWTPFHRLLERFIYKG